jgi:hypothetical protein
VVFLKQDFNKLNYLSTGALVGLFFLLVMHIFASFFYLYWEFWWLDIVMHILGGFLTVLVIVWITERTTFYKKLSFNKKFFFVLFWLFLVTVCWEFFEYFIENVNPSIGYAYWDDTLSDTVAGLLGGSLSFIFVYFYIKKTLP